MKILTQRDPSSQLSTQGEIFIDDLHVCWSLEPADDFVNPEGHKGPIPPGLYQIKIVTPSENFQKKFDPPITRVPEFQNVPNRQAVYCHPGNKPSDTDSCTLPGYEKAPDFVGNSRPAFAAICQRIEQAELHGEEVTWEVKYA